VRHNNGGRTSKGAEMTNSIVEECLYQIGEARDFLLREEDRLSDLIDAVHEGRMTPTAARFAIHLDFIAVHKDLNDYERRLSGEANDAGYPYLHNSLKIARILVPLPEQSA
jgi:hypothetical protein